MLLYMTMKSTSKQPGVQLSCVADCNGSNVQREGQKTKWIIELVAKVDEQYKQEVSQQQQQIVSVLSLAVCHNSNTDSSCASEWKFHV